MRISQKAMFGRLHRLMTVAFIAGAASLATTPDNTALAQGLTPEPPSLTPQFRSAPTFRAYLPPKVDLSRYFPEPGHQGSQGSCVGWAVAYAVRSYYDIKGGLSAVSETPYSPAFLYNSLIGDAPNGCLTGTSISSALSFVQENGLIDINAFPYDQNNCTRKATPTELTAANASKIKGWEPVNYFQLDNIKGRLAKGDPVVAGLSISKDIYDLGWGDIYDNRKPVGDEFGHAVVIVGYDEHKNAFRFLNSWGTEWSEGGYGWISYPAAETRLLSAFYIESDPSSRPVEPEPPVAVADPVPPPAPEPPPPPKADPVPAPQPEPEQHVEPAPQPKPAPKPAETAETVEEPQKKPAPQEGTTEVPAIATDSEDGWQDFMVELTVRNINQLECTHFEATKTADGKIDFKGVTGTQRDGVLAKRHLRGIEDQLGTVDIAIRAWPMCEAIETFWDELNKTDSPTAEVLTGEQKGKLTILKDEEELKFSVRSPDFDGYLYAVYLQANGEAVHLTDPKDTLKLTANGTVTLGEGKNQPRYVIGAPFGDEMILFLSSEAKLETPDHSRVQSDRDFLSQYRHGIFTAREGNPGAQITASAVFLRTKEAE